MEESPADAASPAAKAAGRKANPDVQIARLLVQALWNQQWKAANPDGSAKDRAKAWKAARSEELAARVKPCRLALQALRRSGVEMTLTAAAETAKDSDQD